ncbi:MAG: protein kinase domain-containing protein [Acidobacteriota bacterium]
MKPAPDQNPSGPEQFGPYELHERLGMGGMATVYRAKKRGPEGFERSVALKRMLQHLAEDSSFVDGFIREAKVASMLAHPNIAQVYDFGRINGVYYIAMELVAGSDLRRLLRYANRQNEPIPLPVVFSILAELGDALEYAHNFVDESGTAQRIVHRDISPSNLIVAPTGHVKVIDFGIAKASSRQLRTDTGMVKGKLGYMAPEVALGMSVTAAADVFSMGVVAWELITASPLFTGRTDFDTMQKLREGEIAPPSRHNPVCPPELDQIVLQAVDREVETRLPSAGTFRRALDTIAARYGIATSARAVVEWMQTMPQLQDAWRPSSQPVPREAPTAMLRPGVSTKLRRSDEEIEHASDIWGEDAMSLQSPPAATPDFNAASVVASGPHAFRPATQQPSPAMSAQLTAQHPSGGYAYGTNVQFGAAVPYGQTPAPMRPARRWPWAMVAVLVVGGGAVAGYFVSRTGSALPQLAEGSAAPAGSAAAAGSAGSAVTPPAISQPVHERGTLRFTIDPATAVIEVGGKEVGRSSPLDVELDPGVYTVTVHGDGYKPWSGTLNVAAGEHQTVDVALDKLEEVAATDAVDAGTRHRPSTSHHAHAHVTVATIDKHPTPTVAPDPTPTPDPTPPAKPDPVVPKPDPPKPDPVVPKPDPTPTAPARTPVVGASSVTKLSGDLPAIKGDAASGDVLAKLCIDDSGRVTSARILRAPAGVADKLAHAFDGWRYRPWLNQENRPSPVCFPVTVRVIVKRDD